MYTEVNKDLNPNDLLEEAQKSAKSTTNSVYDFRKSLRNTEKEAASKYHALNTRLWRIIVVFNQFAEEESPGSIGYQCFMQCKEAFKVLIEEAAYDMKRNRDFLSFIDEFSSRIEKLVSNPRDPSYISGLSSFLMDYQTKPGFYKAAKALSSFNHFVLVADSNKAASELVNQTIEEKRFLECSLNILSLKKRLLTLENKAENSLNQRMYNDLHHSDIDLREDFYQFIKKFNR